MVWLLLIGFIIIVLIFFYFNNIRKSQSNVEQIVIKTKDGYIKGHYLEEGLLKGQKYIAGRLNSEGIFLNGIQVGMGKSYYDNGKIKYEGHFEKGVFSGEGKLYEESGRLKYIGNFINGYASGYGKIFDDQGHIKIEGNFKRLSGMEHFSKDPSVPIGRCKEYYSNGKLKYDGEFQNGVWHGQGRYFDSYGKLLHKGTFVNGKPRK